MINFFYFATDLQEYGKNRNLQKVNGIYTGSVWFAVILLLFSVVILYHILYNKIKKGGKVMNYKICRIIKFAAVLLFILSAIVGIIWFFSAAGQYSDSKEFMDDMAMASAKMGMIYSLSLLVSGTIFSLLLYGFGEIIECLSNIDDKLSAIGVSNKKVQKNAPEDMEVNYSEDELPESVEEVEGMKDNSSVWTCGHCGKVNSGNREFCSECGLYK